MASNIEAAMVGMGRVVGPPAPESPSIENEIRRNALRDPAEISLGELNPLVHPPKLDAIEPLINVVRNKIEEIEGITPSIFETVLVPDFSGEKVEPRIIVRFDIDNMSNEQVELLEALVAQTYKAKVRTRMDSDGNEIPAENYPPFHVGKAARSKTGGWYMGPNLAPTTPHHTGLYLYKDFGPVNKENFTDEIASQSKYIVEIRELALYQTDLAELVVQVGSILGQSKMLEHSDLLYEIYYDLIRSGLKNRSSQEVHGIEYAVDMIKRGLVRPLANLDISRGIEQDPESVLLVGIPGTGKTLVAEQLLLEDTGVFIIPIDPTELYKELSLDKQKQSLLPRIAEIANSTGRRVILHIDDIEHLVENQNESRSTHSTLLNLMAGIRDSGFYILASTNEPEKIDPALLQPQRFGVWIHFGLQDEEARLAILQINANRTSKQLHHELFPNDEVRELILRAVVNKTDGFTPRYLAEIATVAKSYLLERIALEKDTNIGLTEKDLEGFQFAVEDWEKATREVSLRYDKTKMKKRDEALKKFVEKQGMQVGFAGSNVDVPSGHFFPPEIRRQIAASLERGS